MSKIAAVIWDLDGVLADTAPHHFRAWRETFAKRGIDFTKADFMRGFGVKNDVVIKGVLGEPTTDEEIETIAKAKEAAFRDIIGKDIKLREIFGVLEKIASRPSL